MPKGLSGTWVPISNTELEALFKDLDLESAVHDY